MDRSILLSLARSSALAPNQLHGAATTLATLEPRALIEIAARGDLDDDVRVHLLRCAPVWLLDDLLSVWPPDRRLAVGAAEREEALSYLVVYCGSQGWSDDAAELARRLPWQDVARTAQRWERKVPGEFPASVRLALVCAAFTERGPRPDLSSMTEWERRRVMDELKEVHEQRRAVVWDLIEHDPGLWPSLAASEVGEHVRLLLLDRADEMSDEVLAACIPDVLVVGLADRSYFGGIRLHIAAGHVRRWPRLRQLAAQELADLVRDVVADGWTPEGDYGTPDLLGIAGLAELSHDRELLARAVAALTAPRTPVRGRSPDTDEEWLAAVLALGRNEAVVAADLVALVPTLDEPAVRAVLEQSEGLLHDACATRLDRLQQAEEAARPHPIPVPDDDTLATSPDPEAQLRDHVRHLKRSAAQRDVTVRGLLASRFVTPDILRALPARSVLEGETAATHLVADMIAEVCADDEIRWGRLAEIASTTPRQSVTFRDWLNDLRSKR